MLLFFIKSSEGENNLFSFKRASNSLKILKPPINPFIQTRLSSIILHYIMFFPIQLYFHHFSIFSCGAW